LGSYRQVRSLKSHNGFWIRPILALMGDIVPKMRPEITMLCKAVHGESRIRLAGERVQETPSRCPESGVRGLSPDIGDRLTAGDIGRSQEGMNPTGAISAFVYPFLGLYRQVRSPKTPHRFWESASPGSDRQYDARNAFGNNHAMQGLTGRKSENIDWGTRPGDPLSVSGVSIHGTTLRNDLRYRVSLSSAVLLRRRFANEIIHEEMIC
jgi:hypothetical protein